jgi:L-fuconolactonase
VDLLGSFPKIYCKISGLTESAFERSGAAPRKPAHYRPYLEALFGAFGPERLLFATNWPVVDRATTAREMLDMIMPFLRELDTDAAQAILGRNACAAYRLQSIDTPG